jgi:hypothetical protein
MSEIPDRIVLRRDRDLVGRRHEIWVRRALLLLVFVLLLLGLLGLFGQRPSTSTATGGGVSLRLYAPARVRGGLLWEARFHIAAGRELKKAFLVLGSGWLEGQTVNTIEPSPIGESSRDGDLVLELGHIPAGQDYLLFMQFQVNPTNVGRRGADVELLDGSRRVAYIHRTLTVFP